MARARVWGWTATSASRKKIRGAVADRAPRFLAAAGPWGVGIATTTAPARRAMAAESSVEPSSTTISSKSVRIESRSRRRQHSKSRPPLRTGTTTESDGLRGPGLVGPAGTSSMIFPRPSGLEDCRNASPSLGSPEQLQSVHSSQSVPRPKAGRSAPPGRSRDVPRDCSRNPIGCQRSPSAPRNCANSTLRPSIRMRRDTSLDASGKAGSIPGDRGRPALPPGLPASGRPG